MSSDAAMNGINGTSSGHGLRQVDDDSITVKSVVPSSALFDTQTNHVSATLM